MMMGEEGVDGELSPEESRPVDEWPPPTSASNLELANKDGTSSRLLFLTVQYVGEESSGASFNTGLEGFTELEHRVVSPLDPNMGCTACLSPVYRPSSPSLMSAPMSPTSSYLNPPSPTVGHEPGMIVLSEPCHYTSADNFVVASNSRMYSHTPLSEAVTAADDTKQLLLLSTDTNNSAELVVAGDTDCGDQRVELLLSNGTIAYGIVESTDDTGTRVIQIPREYLVTTRAEPNDLPSEEGDIRQVDSIQHETVLPVQDDTDDGSHLRALYNTLKEQGLIIDPGQSNLDQQLIDPSLLNQTTLPVPVLEPQPQEYTSLPPQKRFWCEECNVLLEADCREHQVDRKISDKAVPSRARATLPAAYLSINTISDTKNNQEEEGVFARKNIPKRTQFGPIEGLIVKPNEIIISDVRRLELTIETETGEMKTLDVSNEHMSNWMRFVRVATPERPANLLLSQLGASLFFTTTHMITARHELLVWYSPAYASRRGLPVMPPPPEWPCSTCGMKLKNVKELTAHSNCHRNNPPITLPVLVLDNTSLPLLDSV